MVESGIYEGLTDQAPSLYQSSLHCIHFASSGNREGNGDGLREGRRITAVHRDHGSSGGGSKSSGGPPQHSGKVSIGAVDFESDGSGGAGPLPFLRPNPELGNRAESKGTGDPPRSLWKLEERSRREVSEAELGFGAEGFHWRRCALEVEGLGGLQQYRRRGRFGWGRFESRLWSPRAAASEADLQHRCTHVRILEGERGWKIIRPFLHENTYTTRAPQGLWHLTARLVCQDGERSDCLVLPRSWRV